MHPLQKHNVVGGKYNFFQYWSKAECLKEQLEVVFVVLEVAGVVKSEHVQVMEKLAEINGSYCAINLVVYFF